MAKVHKITLLVVQPESDIKNEELETLIEDANDRYFATHCIRHEVSKEFEWVDDNVWNYTNNYEDPEKMETLFEEIKEKHDDKN